MKDDVLRIEFPRLASGESSGSSAVWTPLSSGRPSSKHGIRILSYTSELPRPGK